MALGLSKTPRGSPDPQGQGGLWGVSWAGSGPALGLGGPGGAPPASGPLKQGAQVSACVCRVAGQARALECIPCAHGCACARHKHVVRRTERRPVALGESPHPLLVQAGACLFPQLPPRQGFLESRPRQSLLLGSKPANPVLARSFPSWQQTQTCPEAGRGREHKPPLCGHQALPQSRTCQGPRPLLPPPSRAFPGPRDLLGCPLPPAGCGPFPTPLCCLWGPGGLGAGVGGQQGKVRWDITCAKGIWGLSPKQPLQGGPYSGKTPLGLGPHSRLGTNAAPPRPPGPELQVSGNRAHGAGWLCGGRATE